MARVRYLGPEPVTVPELGDRKVEPDEVVEVPDERYWGYACQTTNWEEVQPPADFVPPGSEPEGGEPQDQAAAEDSESGKAVIAKKTVAPKAAAKTQKTEG